MNMSERYGTKSAGYDSILTRAREGKGGMGEAIGRGVFQVGHTAAQIVAAQIVKKC